MDITRATAILDPKTRDQALAVYTDNCALRTAQVEEACQTAVDFCRKTNEAIKDAGFSSLTDFLYAYRIGKAVRDIGPLKWEEVPGENEGVQCPRCKTKSWTPVKFCSGCGAYMEVF